MAFPALTLRSGAAFVSEATGTPTDGTNAFDHGIATRNIDEAAGAWFEITVIANGPSIRDVTFVSANSTRIVLSFDQRGTDTARIIARWRHSITR